MTADRSVIALSPNPGRPIGFIEGIRGSDCEIEVTAFRLEDEGTSAPDVRQFVIIGLPPGDYRYRASMRAPAMTLNVPGSGIKRYQVPPGCPVCK